jgi:hypothetical protein
MNFSQADTMTDFSPAEGLFPARPPAYTQPPLAMVAPPAEIHPLFYPATGVDRKSPLGCPCRQSPASDTSAFKRMRAFVSGCAERLPLLINSSSWARFSAVNRTTYFLTAISFPATNHLHRWLAATEIQKLPSFSMTEAD